nr:cell division protein FtsL [uncultured Bacillus sp.]
MGNLANQLRREQQVEHKQKDKFHVNKRATDKNSLFSPGEKILGVIFGAFVCFGAVHIISNQASIYALNKDIEVTKKDIQEQQRINSDLNIQVSELSQYDRIKEKARELGLELNDQNVKVVQE